MERVYRKAQTNKDYLASKRNAQTNKPLISLKKLATQTIVSIIMFVSVYSMQFFDNPFCEAILNESAYAVSYTVDFQTLYTSSKQVFKYFLGGIEQSRTYIDSVVFNQNNVGDKQIQDTLKTNSQPEQNATP